ncbi:entericidin A/B family lipoprotein [Parachitinimonas caeni]|uniref:Entericidin A/B family lipoprotein n=1 Tax=Parachitinimonas caeni TaxID=3031301 RepID=A0ABT7E0G3_9NEIS|nr:entericidin A/B family lipoprotein [Parachitinimonas caeni]MDK2125729.1 entericidin A/B family lipoprotein [Parachitinimonas caeni]
MRKTFLGLLASLCAVSLAGCNTISGIGKDIKRGGQAIERAAS